MEDIVNLPEVVQEVAAEFLRYEDALVNNRVEVLDEIFWESIYTIRFGVTENLYGYDAIKEFRASRSSAGLQRTLRNTVITTFGYNLATANTEFTRTGTPKIGRQSQTWIRTALGWRVVAAHVSLCAD